MLNWNDVDKALRWIARISIFLIVIPSALVVLIVGLLTSPMWFPQLLDNSYDGRLRGDDAKDICDGHKVGLTCTHMEGTNTNVALDDSACVALSLHKQQGFSGRIKENRRRRGLSQTDELRLYPQLRWSVPPDNEGRFNQALRSGRILGLKPGLKTKFVKGIYAENGRLVPVDPVSEEDMLKHSGVSMTIVSIQEGTMKGRLVCVPDGALWPRFGPML